MKNFRYIIIVLILFVVQPLSARERVYVSTDKECYLAGESVWYSLYCMDENMQPSALSSVAYIDLCNNEGVAATLKFPLVDGRGCGRFVIPFSFATGNYSIVAYTRAYGGNSITPFNGKIITIFNTLTSERVKDGVEVVPKGESVESGIERKGVGTTGAVSVEVPRSGAKRGERLPVRINNGGGKPLSLSVSVYNLSGLERMIGRWGYDGTTLLERKGDFERSADVDYAGEMIKVQIKPKQGAEDVDVKGKNVYMSAVNGDKDVFVATSDSLGVVRYFTNNIYGKRDLVFDVASNVNIAKSVNDGEESEALDIVLLNEKYDHKHTDIPVLKISEDMMAPLSGRGVDMQISRRFDRDTLYELMPMRGAPLTGEITPVVYRLDEYTRFPVMEDVIREYVKRLRIRKFEKSVDLQVSCETSVDNYNFSGGNALALLDGVPVRDHKLLVDFDPLLVKEIVIYPRQVALNNFLYGGIVEFRTYNGDMGGLQLGNNIKIIPYDGVAFPLAMLGGKLSQEENYPNYNRTIYWNPVVGLGAGSSFGFDLLLPAYGGEFRIVVEGVDGEGKEIYHSETFDIL
ncbi:MAG: hypothetical protein IKD16_01190 [Bacteroidales bacterium]|nr:hypothetical protein [Bacteroidales bacterium]